VISAGRVKVIFLVPFPVAVITFRSRRFALVPSLRVIWTFLGAQFLRNGVADDEGDLFAWGGGFGGDEGDEFLVALVLRLFVFSTGGATGGGFLLFFIGVKMADFGIVAFLECLKGVVSWCRTFW
jgi:hypothetical protein